MTLSAQWATLIGAILGLLISPLSTYMIQHKQEKRDRRGLAAGLLGEIDALLLVAVNRNWVAGFKNDIQKLSQQNATKFQQHISVSQDYFKIYSTNGMKIGTLGEEVACKVALAYNLAMSVIEDFRTIQKPFETAGEQKAYYEEMVTIFELTIEKGKEAKQSLEKYLKEGV